MNTQMNNSDSNVSFDMDSVLDGLVACMQQPECTDHGGGGGVLA